MATRTKELQKRVTEAAKKVNPKKVAAATGGIVGLGILYAIFKKDPIPFKDTTVPDGEVDQAKVIAMAAELNQRLERFQFNIFSSDRCNTLRVYEKFSNAEFVAVANYYQKKYRKTIRQAIEGTIALDCFNPDPVEHIYIRFRELNVP